jgi:sigma-E factor negative regulatory protein RseC
MREVMDVIDKDESYVYLRTTRTQECESCAMKGGCTLLGGSNELNLKAKNTEKVDVKKGDKVVVELPEVPVVKLSFLAYGIPLIVFLSIISILYTLSFSDIFSFLAGILGMGITYFLIHQYDRKKLKDRYLPVILQKLEKKIDLKLNEKGEI